MWSNIRNKAVTFAVAGAMAAASIGAASAAPLPTGTASVKTAQSDAITNVRWRGGGGAVVAGLAAGVIGAAAANAWGPRYYYGAPYGYYGAPYPAYGYGYGRPYYHRHYGWHHWHHYRHPRYAFHRHHH